MTLRLHSSQALRLASGVLLGKANHFLIRIRLSYAKPASLSGWKLLILIQIYTASPGHPSRQPNFPCTPQPLGCSMVLPRRGFFPQDFLGCAPPLHRQES